MQDILVVVDMQNDFIDGALGTKEAVTIVPKVEEKIRNFHGTVLFTRDTHENWYLETQEGKKLPVPHCIRDTEGWQIRRELDILRKTEPVDKETFGSTDLADDLVAMNIDDEIKVDFHFIEAGVSTIFVYKKNNSYYIEQPYNGIYQISGDEYNSIEKLVR